MNFEFQNLIRKHTGTIVLLFLMFSGAYYVLEEKKRENAEIMHRFEAAKPTLPAYLYEDIAMLRWKIAQENLRARVLEKDIIAVRKLMIEKEIKQLRAKANLLQKESDDIITLPGIKRFLPHLQNYDPKVVTSRQIKTNYTIAYGLPINTVARLPLLMKTIDSLLDHLKEEEKETVVFVVYVNLPTDNSNKVVDTLTRKYDKEILSGLLRVIIPPKNYYPNFFDKSLYKQFGDISEEKAVANMKQNLDFVYLMLYAETTAIFYVHLTDDIVAKPDYSWKIRQFAIEKYVSERPWFELDFSANKCAGNLYRTADIPKLSVFYLMHYYRKNCDWLMASFIGTIKCNMEVSDCPQLIKYHRIKYRPELFVKGPS